MLLKPLTSEDDVEWAQLLAVCFDRHPDQMLRLLDWLWQLYDLVAWGLWDGGHLVAQYACLVRPILMQGETRLAGMSINMAVHPRYRGQGLVKQVAQPVYDQVRDRGGALGVGFSNRRGVRVDQRSRSYGYQVVGQMRPIFHRLTERPADRLALQEMFPNLPFAPQAKMLRRHYLVKTPRYFSIRYGQHPFRRYRYALWLDGDCALGVVVYRDVGLPGLRGAALLDVFGVDIPELVNRWAQTMHAQGAAFVQGLYSPQSTVRTALGGSIFSPPFARSPYYFTLKPLADDLHPSAFQFDQWDLIGGDVL